MADGGPTGDLFFDLCCDGCKHLTYTKPDGHEPSWPGADPAYIAPHARCGYFKAYIPAVKERGKVVFYQAPKSCPTRLRLSQGKLL